MFDIREGTELQFLESDAISDFGFRWLSEFSRHLVYWWPYFPDLLRVLNGLAVRHMSH